MKQKLMLALEAAELEVDKVADKIEFYDNGTQAQRTEIDSEEPVVPVKSEDDTDPSTDDDNADTVDSDASQDADSPADTSVGDETTDESTEGDADPVKDSEDNSKDTDDAVATATSLEAISLALTDSLRYGGTSKSGIKISQVAIESYLKHIGLKDKTISKEDFSDYADAINSKYHATKKVIGHIGDILGKVWNGIRVSISFSIDILGKIIKKFETGFKGYLKECISLKASLSNMKNLQNQDHKYTNQRVIQNLFSGNLFEPQKTITILNDFAKSYFSNIKSSATISTKNIHFIIENVENRNFTGPSKLIKLPALPDGVRLGKVDGYVPESDSLDTYVYKDKLPGNSLFIVYYPKENNDLEELDDAQRKSKFLLGIGMSEVNIPTESNYLSSRNISPFIDKLEEIANEGIASIRIFNDFLETKKHLANELNKLGKLNEYEIDQHKKNNLDVKEYIRAISSTLQRYDNTYIDGSSKVADLMLRTLKSGTTFVSDNIKFYT